MTGIPESANNGSPPFGLDQVRGLNVAEGLDRVAGNRMLYKNVLIEFRDTYRNVTDQIWELLEAKRWREAEALVHTVKGTSGMLSADALFGATAELDARLKVARDTGSLPADTDAAFERFHRALARLMEDLDRLAASASPP